MKHIEVLPAAVQGAWRWQAAANFILVGAGTGFYLLSFVAIVLEQGLAALSIQIPNGLLAPILVSIGFMVLTTEAGRPSRGIYLFSNLGRAWLSRETLFFSLFVPVVILDWFIPYPVFRIISILAALALMLSQGSILYQIRAIAGWNLLLVPALFISSGFASGGGVTLLIAGCTGSLLPFSTIIMEIAALGANLTIWLFYLYGFHSNAVHDATAALRRSLFLIITVGFGHIFPLVFLSSMAGSNYSLSASSFPAETISGLAILLGVILQKKAVVLTSSNMKAVTIETSAN